MSSGGIFKRKGTSALSRRVTHFVTTRLPSGRVVTQHETLTTSQLRRRQADERKAQRARLEAMKTSELQELANLQAGAASEWEDVDNGSEMAIDQVLAGEEGMDVSYGGGEFEACAAELLGNKKRAHDYRHRRDRNERRTKAFEAQLPAMVDAYMAWQLASGEHGLGGEYTLPEGATVAGSLSIRRVDTYSAGLVTISLIDTDALVSCALLRQGLVPCAPYGPTTAITIRTLEVFRVAQLRCPRLSIHAFVKTLCDLHGVPFQPYLSRQFSICHDLHLALRAAVHDRVQAALRRDTPDWRLANCCPTCTYRLEDEAPLKFSMLYTVDGNDSLKRIIRREQVPDDDTTERKLGASKESFDSRNVHGDMYLSRAQVDEWSDEGISAWMASGATYHDEDPDDDNPCVERWRNMRSEITARMWGVFEETGLFLSLCRHGFVLVLADMIRSGEQSKYPLAIVNKMVNVFGDNLALGYDIGCRFDTTLKKCPPIGPRIRSTNHTCLVGAFHGHAHNRLCQSRFLATYVHGLGIEDLEGCERFFSKSNDLAGSTRYASEFHRKQSIVTYCKHNDTFETYQNLSKFILDNYKQALAILDTKDAVMEAMAKLGATGPGVMERWLKEEEDYLRGLKREPEEETLEMEYYTALVNLRTTTRNVAAIPVFINQYSTDQMPLRDNTAAIETSRRHALQKRDLCLDNVQALEVRLQVTRRWEPESPEWKAVAEKVVMRRYQRSIDHLEGLVVARMFELTKMNQSHTGYSLRKHIGNALKARSQAIRTALARYNDAASELVPPRRTLEWDEVVEYAFLADFDLLRDTRQDIRLRPWASPGARLTMDAYFKLQRASEEIDRLNVEIKRFATYLRDEDEFLRAREAELQESSPALAHAVSLHRSERGRFNNHHHAILFKIYNLKGFTGSSTLGIHLPTPFPGSTPPTIPPLPPQPSPLTPMDAPQYEEIDHTEESMQEEQEDEDEEVTVLHAMHEVINLAFDSSAAPSQVD